MDTSAHVIRLHGVDQGGATVLSRDIRRKHMLAFFGGMLPTVIAIKVDTGSDHWARLLVSLGHEARLIPVQYLNSAPADGTSKGCEAEALCEALLLSETAFVPAKSAEQQVAIMLIERRKILIKMRSALSDAALSYAYEFSFNRPMIGLT